MKKLLLSIIIAGLGVLQLNAQEKGDIELGIGSGVNFSEISVININTDNNISLDTGHLFGFNIGASGEYYFSDRLGIKIKLIYDGKGFSDAFVSGENFQQNTDITLNYLTVPIMANLHFSSRRNWYVNAGPFVGFLLSVKDSEGFAEEFGIDIEEGFKNTDLGLAFGIGYKIKIVENFKFYFEFDGQLGFLDIIKENEIDPITNSRYSINIGGLFAL